MAVEASLLVVWVGAGLWAVRWIPGTWVLLVSFLGAYVFSMLLLSPDLDLASSRAFARWGIMRWIWIPYVKLFRHRRASHHLLWGPVSRVAYLTGMVAILLVVLGACLGPRHFGIIVPRDTLAAVALGLYVPNLEHIVADRLASPKRERRSKRRL